MRCSAALGCSISCVYVYVQKTEEKLNEQKERRQKLKSAWRKNEKEQRSQGKAVFFQKKCSCFARFTLGSPCGMVSCLCVWYVCAAAQKEIELADQYLKLRATGQVDQFMAKRRKKNASKDHRWVLITLRLSCVLG